MELFRQTHIDFLRWKWWAIGASWALILVGLIAIFVQKGLKFGIDFAGGTQIALRFVQRPDIDHLRKILDTGHFGDTGIQRYEAVEKNEVLIRVQQQRKEGRDITAEVLNLLRQGLGSAADASKLDLNTQGRDSLAARLVAADPDQVAGKSGQNPTDYYGRIAEQVIARRSQMGLFRSSADVNSVPGLTPAVKGWIQANAAAGPFVLLSAGSVGPQVGADLRQKALWAIATSTFGMLLYIWWRFRSLPFGVGAIVATVQPRRGRGAPDAHRLLGQRHGGGVRPDPREPAHAQEGAARDRDQPLDQSDAVADRADLGRHDAGRRGALLPRGRGAEHLRSDADHRDRRRDLLLDLRGLSYRRDLETGVGPPQARPRPRRQADGAGAGPIPAEKEDRPPLSSRKT
jgi:hypothetical protein